MAAIGTGVVAKRGRIARQPCEGFRNPPVPPPTPARP